MNGLPTDQVLAVLRLPQWAQDRAALKIAKTTNYKRHGWRERRTCETDARLVRVIDFEKAFARLSQEEQTALPAARQHTRYVRWRINSRQLQPSRNPQTSHPTTKDRSPLDIDFSDR